MRNLIAFFLPNYKVKKQPLTLYNLFVPSINNLEQLVDIPRLLIN